MSPCHWVSKYGNVDFNVFSKFFWNFYSSHLLLTCILGLVNVLWQSSIFLFLRNQWKHSLLTKECQDGQCTTWRPIYYRKCTGKCWSKICSLFHMKKHLVSHIQMKFITIIIFIFQGSMGRTKSISENVPSWNVSIVSSQIIVKQCWCHLSLIYNLLAFMGWKIIIHYKWKLWCINFII